MNDPRWSIANIVRDQLIRSRRIDLEERIHRAAAINNEMLRFGQITRKLRLAQQRRYEAAGRRLVRQAGRMLIDLRYGLEVAVRQLDPPQSLQLNLRDITRELEQLADEFGPWSFDSDSHVLSVETEPIDLEGIYLGPFAIQLRLNDLSQASRHQPFEIEALDPHPAAGHDHVTHPHVSDGGLCAGDATTPIVTALLQGRLCDFFLIVRQVLTTYNPGSPYVALDQWDGEPCYDCGYRVEGDCRFFCERCGYDFCDECVGSCICCDVLLCRSCLSTCPQCEEPVCDVCLKACAQCSESCCADCLIDELCPNCHEQLEHEHEQEDENPNEEYQHVRINSQAPGQETEKTQVA